MRTTRTRNISTLLSVLFFVMVLSPLGAQPAAERSLTTEAIVSVTDSRGVTITLSSYPSSVVSLSPNITETIYALGALDLLVGRTDYCDYPPEVQSIPAVGDLLTPNVERIVALEPDLVIVSNLGQLQTIEAIERAGIPVAFIDEPEKMEGTYDIITKTGALIGKSSEARKLVHQMRQSIDAIALLPEEERPTVYYAAGFGEWGDFTATGDTFIHDIITLAGGKNIASDAVNWSFQLELLHARDPDIIILPALWGSTYDETLRQFVSHPSYRPLSAVKRGRIVTIESNMIERQGPRSAEATVLLAELIHGNER